MSDDHTPRETAPGATLTCDAGVTPASLSAWRDGLLPADQTQWLAAHAPACPACSARLRDYEQIGVALRGQVIPQSAADPWPAMRRRIEREGRERRERRGRRQSLPRWGGLGALVAAALLVALFAGLLAQQAARRPAPGSTATVAASPIASPTTTTPALGAWTQVPGYKGLYNLAVAPSDPRVAYQLGNDANGAQIFRRTDDQGATWHNLTLPNIANASYPVVGAWSGVTVNPLDARVAYLSIAAAMKSPITSCTSNGGGDIDMTSPVCKYLYISVDSGAHWRLMSLPVVGELSAPTLAQDGLMGQRDTSDAASPSRLYSPLFQRSTGAMRLMRSDDNGVTWRLIDGAIVAAGQYATSFAATPTGSTIFAVSSSHTGSGRPTTPETIWSSDDDGATWTNLGPAPNTSIMQMIAVRVASSGKPILYLLMTADNQNSVSIWGSLYGDSGGFHLAPYLASSCTSGSGYLLGSLADGSVLAWCGGAVEAWLTLPARVDQGWRTVAPNPGVQSIYTAFTQTLPDGSSRLWLLTQDNTGAVAQYITLPN
jgi:hypothetical protein